MWAGTRSSIALRARCSALSTETGVISSVSAVSRAEKPRTSEDQDGSLPGGQVLERGGEGELDALSLFVARIRAEQRGFDAELGVGVGLEPDRLGERLAESYVWIGRWTVVDREHALGPLLDQAQAGVGGDPTARSEASFDSRSGRARSTRGASSLAARPRHRAMSRAFGSSACKLGLVRPEEEANASSSPACAASSRCRSSLIASAPRRDFPASGLETTLRHPDGPSRGSSSTSAPSSRARSVDRSIRSTST